MNGMPDSTGSKKSSMASTPSRRTLLRNSRWQGRHFAAWEQPQALTEELRTGFKSLRSAVAKSAA